MTKKNSIKTLILGTFLSLALFGLINASIEWGTEKCPWDTEKTKIVVYMLIVAIVIWILYM